MSSGTYVHASGNWKSVSGLYYKLSGSWKTVKSAFVRQSGVWKQVYGTLLSATVDSDYQYATGFPSTTVTTSLSTVTPAGGAAPYTHSWAYVSGDTSIYCAYGLGTNAQAWKRTLPSGYGDFVAVWRDTVTDSLGATVTVDVTIEIETSL